MGFFKRNEKPLESGIKCGRHIDGCSGSCTPICTLMIQGGFRKKSA
jgi:hypothetical protein